MSYHRRKKIYKTIPGKLRPENYFQALLSLQRIKRNLYWKMKLIKQAIYFRYVLL